ncbi:serine/threonine-protein kinase [Actinoplanes sp. CA-030573]|uniref:serine/threonine-protein kinase n=1 Tax=Actinoplanes sp. CA-030573 TaxID=3239898 RepID=UPI003D8C6AD9
MRTGDLVAGRYRLVEPLGAGGLSRVWLAWDKEAGLTVAIKQGALPEGIDPAEADQFRDLTVREARAFSRVSHPHLVRTMAVIPAAEAPWIVMEYVPARSLQQIIDEDGPLSPERAARLGRCVLAALAAVHRAGLLHLDVKPSNVLIADDGRVKLADFSPAVTAEAVRELARAGIVFGSPKYLAPERLAEGEGGPESDLWSLGATLYHAVEGRPPFDRPTITDILRALGEDPPDPMQHAGPLLPVLKGLLRRDPAARPSAAEVEADLRAIVLPEPAGRRLSLRPSPARRRLALAVAAFVALMALLTVATSARPHPAPDPGPAPAGTTLPGR